jgi:hypothetical protein
VRRKLRLSIVLPVTQVAITAILTFWANRVDWMVFGGDGNRVPGRFARVDLVIIDLRLFWRGVNAPTFPLCMFHGNPTSWTLGLGAGGLLNLLAVALLWYLVGRFFDRRRGLDVPNEWQTTARKRAISVLLTAWGIFLLGISILGVRDSLHLFDASRLVNLSFLLHFRPYVLWNEALFLLWSLILITFHGTALAGTMRSGGAQSMRTGELKA